jgi:UDP-2,4-diacetamido-2,4,6-trideoxy-beta-L-altropyranose hydrolase
MRRVVLRADGSSSIGFGHIYRLLALAEILKEDFECLFATTQPQEFVVNEIKDRGIGFIPLTKDITIPTTTPENLHSSIPFDLDELLTGDEIVVTDGCVFGREYQQIIKSKGCKLICIDDLALSEFFSDAIINHAPGIDPDIYNAQPYTQIFTGLDYAILRKAFLKPFVSAKRNSKDVFISFGGADYNGYTEKLVNILLHFSEFENLHVLCTSSFNTDLIKNLKKTQEIHSRVKLYFNLNADQIVDIQDHCSFAVASASTVLIEAYSRGLKCFAGYYVDNQKLSYEGFIRNQLAFGLGQFEFITHEQIGLALENQQSIQRVSKPLCSDMNILKIFKSI